MRAQAKRMTGIFLSVLVAAVSFAGCSKKTEETAIQATRVQTQAAARGTLEITGTYIGTVTPHNSVNVTPLVSGTVKTVRVKVGDKVKEGDILCQFDDTAADLQLQSAQNAVESAKAGKDAAKEQIKSAKKQADASITSMEGQIKTLKAQKKSYQKQLEQLEDSLDSLKEAQEASAEGYAAAKRIYDSANTLYIQYQAFLSANPDCATTAGLTAASIPSPVVPETPVVPVVPEMPVVQIQADPVLNTGMESVPEGSADQIEGTAGDSEEKETEAEALETQEADPTALETQEAEPAAFGIQEAESEPASSDTQEAEPATSDTQEEESEPAASDSQEEETGQDEETSRDEGDASDADTGRGGDESQRDAEEDPEDAEAAAEKQKTALELATALTEIPLTVEYLTEAGLNTLKDQMEQAQAAYTAASTGYSQAVASVAQLESGIDQIKAQIDALEDNIDAAEDAADAVGSTKAYDAQIKAAQTGVDSAQYQKDLYTVKSPIDGIVESVNVSENEIAAQGYPAFTISDKEEMEVSFYVPEDVRDFLKPGDEVRVETSTGDVKGRISSIGTAVDAQKGLFQIKAEITTVTDKTLLSNTSVSLSLVTNSVSGQILIPFDAVYYDNDQAYVFVAKRDGAGGAETSGGAVLAQALRRDVTAGPYNNDRITILEGLSEGEEVITTWGAGLKDGAPVQILETQK